MTRLHGLPALLLALSFKTRLALAVGSTLIFCLIYLLLPAPVRNPAFLCVPLVLNTWLFKTRGLLLTMAGTLLAQWTFYSLSARGQFLPLSIIASLLVELLAFTCVGLLVNSLHIVLDRAQREHERMVTAYAKLQQTQQARDQYIANTTHELRTSLTSVTGYLDLLDEHDDMLNEETRTLFLRYAKEGADELMTSVNSVLDTIRSHIEARPVKIEPVVVREVVREVLDHFAPQFVQNHPTTIEVDEWVMVYADQEYLRQVVRNLLSNAFKYSPSGAPVTVSAGLCTTGEAAHAPKQICISVQDRGPGIPPSEQTRIFQQFARLERDMAGPVSGSGIGLYTSKQLVEEMGGRIWVESSGIRGEGSTFRFVLPCACQRNPEQYNATLALFSW